RVTYKVTSPGPVRNQAGASNDELLEALKPPEDWPRHQAKRVLKERGAKVLPALATWLKKVETAGKADEHLLLEALWVYQTLDVTEPQLLARLLEAKEPHIRAAATRVLGYWQARLTSPQQVMARLVQDDHPQVR